MRKTFEELNELKEKFNTDRLWSWSRINSVHNSLYEYYLKYVAHEKEDRTDSIYVVTGGLSHEIIENLYENKITKDQMIEDFNDAWTTAFDIGDLKFNRSDSEKNNSLADNYYKNLEHFFKNHKVIENKLAIEQFVAVKIGEEYLQGYIDALMIDDDKNYHIIDWKTSSLYKGDKALNECGQLVVYAIALNQKGIPYDKIKICWNFLKYCNVTVFMKNGTSKVRQIERSKIGDSLQANCKTWLKNFGYSDDDIFKYLDELIQTNSIECLPLEVQEKYIFEDCYVYVDLTDELIKKWEDYIIDTTALIRSKEEEYNNTHDESVWMESQEDVANNSYYFANLCSYSANKHKPYKIYLDNLEREKNGDIFGNVPTKKDDSYDENDLSWINDL